MLENISATKKKNAPDIKSKSTLKLFKKLSGGFG